MGSKEIQKITSSARGWFSYSWWVVFAEEEDGLEQQLALRQGERETHRHTDTQSERDREKLEVGIWNGVMSVCGILRCGVIFLPFL
jgi:hypothetical protein